METNKEFEQAIKDDKEEIHKEVFLIYGQKGEGKTTTALGFPGTILALSFDRKTIHPKKYMYNNDKRIRVIDAVKFLDSDPEHYTQTSSKTFDYVIYILTKLTSSGNKPDWILVDGMEILSQICEMKMRFNAKLSPSQGISNLNLWKDRRLFLRKLHNTALKSSNKGIIYTTYVKKDEIVKEGDVVTKMDVPSWIDVVKWETDYVIRTRFSYDKLKGKKILAHIMTSKNDNRLNTGDLIDITNKKLPINFDKEGKEKT